ncbi:hypothetical protein Q9L58_004062 [Maublancomyces gigas]|uniref:Uncharacterized protein n=1 Tax=Discina gigas TaxID=1032678 RepID=A0ABR3GM22_9PEZI
MTVADDKVYLVTNVAYPGHFLTIAQSMQSNIIASTAAVNCWHLKHNTDKDEWPRHAPASNTYSLKMVAEDKGRVFIASSEFKLKLTAMDNASLTG